MKLQDDIRSICSEQKKTIIFVTHDIEEAVYLSDRVVIMTPNPGRIKTVVKLSLRKSRDRTADDFLLMRDKLFELFNMKHEEAQIEYII
jgi:NitT/TauT family transport system ATP-binding protein